MFQNRLIVPVYSDTNQLLGFHGRTLIKNGCPQWLLVHDPTWSCQDHFYGLNHFAHGSSDCIILVEDEFTVLHFRCLGFFNTVCPAHQFCVSERACVRLRKYTNQVVVLTGIDEYGQKLSRKWKEKLERHDIRACIPRLTAMRDPNEFLRRYGPEPMHSVIKTALNTAN